jgi:hypothetical protein
MIRTALILAAFAIGTNLTVAGVLTGDQLKEKVVGKTCTWTNGKASGASFYAADASAKVTDARGDAHEGTWRIKGNQLCDKYPVWRPKESCFTFDEVGPGSYKGSIGFTANCS